MKPNTALGLLLLGASIALRVAPGRPGLRPMWLAAAALAGLIGAASLAEYVTGWTRGSTSWASDTSSPIRARRCPAVADLDGLKKINDERGHAAGDEALLRVAAVLRLATRPTDVAARVGGDEYVVLLPKTDADGARRIVARVAHLLGEQLADDGATGVSVKMGTATWAPGDDPAAVLARADRAMYDQKRAEERATTAGI